MSFVTLHPGGNNPPSPSRKANILAALGAAAQGHGHAMGDVIGLVAALNGKTTLLVASEEPPATPLAFWYNPLSGALAVHHGGIWRVMSGGLTNAVTVSDVPPTSPAEKLKPWFDTTSATFAVWVEDAQAWVMVGGGANGRDGQDLTQELTVKPVAATTYTILLTDANCYLRFNGSGAKTVSIPSLALAVGSLLSLRNVTAGDLTIAPVFPVTVNAVGGLLTVTTNTTAQLVYTGGDIWDLL